MPWKSPQERERERPVSLVNEWRIKGAAHMRGGRWQDALDAYEQAVAADPANAGAWHDKCLALDKLGRTEEALNACNKSLEADPAFADAWRDKANLLGRLGRPEEGLAAFDNALKMTAAETLKLYGKDSMFLGAYLGRSRKKQRKWDLPPGPDLKLR